MYPTLVSLITKPIIWCTEYKRKPVLIENSNRIFEFNMTLKVKKQLREKLFLYERLQCYIEIIKF